MLDNSSLKPGQAGTVPVQTLSWSYSAPFGNMRDILLQNAFHFKDILFLDGVKSTELEGAVKEVEPNIISEIREGRLR
jgi:hypothetical protein